jgi:16S rRNA (uracil1498-N3)-methyltransferase
VNNVPQFFVNISDISDGKVTIRGDDFHHLVKVRRVSPGDRIFIRTSDGVGYEAGIQSIQSDHLYALIEKEIPYEAGATALGVYLCLLKGANFELALQKCAEAGVSEITPVISERTIPDIKGKVDKKNERWNKIVSEAAKQCLRGDVPAVNMPVDFKTAVTGPGSEVRLIAHPGGETALKTLLRGMPPPASADLLIGPEGGFSIDELKHAEDNGWVVVSAGPNHLRGETAAIVIPSIILYEWS